MPKKAKAVSVRAAMHSCDIWLKAVNKTTEAQMRHNAPDLIWEAKIKVETLLMAIEEDFKAGSKKAKRKTPKKGSSDDE